MARRFCYNNLTVLRLCVIVAFVMLSIGVTAKASKASEQAAKKLFSKTKSAFVLDAELLLADVKYLSSDMLGGRKPATKGSQLAENYIIETFKALKLKKLTADYRQVFSIKQGKKAANVLGLIEGRTYPNHYWVITAHYDHLGKQGSKIYNGANDNASGVAALLALARYFSNNPPVYSLILLATDAEEDGLYGAKHFVSNPPVELPFIVLNLNLDMIGHGGRKNRLFISGIKHHEHLKRLVLPLMSELSLSSLNVKIRRNSIVRTGVMRGKRVNWKQASDHGAFIKKGIPYVYLGADANSTYHTTRDTYERLNPDFYLAAVNAAFVIMTEVETLSPKQLKNKS